MSLTFEVRNGDIVMDLRTGRPKTVADGLKLRQDIGEMLTTESLPDNIGAGLESIVDGQPRDASDVRIGITAGVQRAIAIMQSLQSRHNRAVRPPSEQVLRLRRVDAAQVDGSRVDYYFRVEVQTADGGTVSSGGQLG